MMLVLPVSGLEQCRDVLADCELDCLQGTDV